MTVGKYGKTKQTLLWFCALLVICFWRCTSCYAFFDEVQSLHYYFSASTEKLSIFLKFVNFKSIHMDLKLRNDDSDAGYKYYSLVRFACHSAGQRRIINISHDKKTSSTANT